jgi:hypothetical protein
MWVGARNANLDYQLVPVAEGEQMVNDFKFAFVEPINSGDAPQEIEIHLWVIPQETTNVHQFLRFNSDLQTVQPNAGR